MGTYIGPQTALKLSSLTGDFIIIGTGLFLSVIGIILLVKAVRIYRTEKARVD